MGWHGLDISGSELGQVAGCCKHGNKPLGSIKFGLAENQLASREGLCFNEYVCVVRARARVCVCMEYREVVCDVG